MACVTSRLDARRCNLCRRVSSPRVLPAAAWRSPLPPALASQAKGPPARGAPGRGRGASGHGTEARACREVRALRRHSPTPGSWDKIKRAVPKKARVAVTGAFRRRSQRRLRAPVSGAGWQQGKRTPGRWRGLLRGVPRRPPHRRLLPVPGVSPPPPRPPGPDPAAAARLALAARWRRRPGQALAVPAAGRAGPGPGGGRGGEGAAPALLWPLSRPGVGARGALRAVCKREVRGGGQEAGEGSRQAASPHPSLRTPRGQGRSGP